MKAAPFNIDATRELLVFKDHDMWVEWYDTTELAYGAKFPAKEIPEMFIECPFTISPDSKDLIDVQIVNHEEGAYMVVPMLITSTRDKQVLCVPITYDDNIFRHPMSLN